MTITIGWYAVPLAIMLAAFSWVFIVPIKHVGDYGVDIMPIIRLAVAIIVSLAAWLVWAVLT